MLVTRASLKGSVVTLSCRSGVTAGDTTIQMGSLISKKMIESQNSRGQAAALNHQRQGGHINHKGKQGCASN